MSPEAAIALSFASPSALQRSGLGDRLRADDPHLLELAASLASRVETTRATAAAAGVRVIAWNEPTFPGSLLTLPDFPPAIWYQGHLEILDDPAVAIVGSRAASAVAIETATRIAADLARRGVAVVSGLARGVDSAAHRGALQTGHTVAVLGSGLDRVYPTEHAPLAMEIAARGVVISEHPPGTPPLKHHFPLRNRLISGLSRAVVVIEANEKSGSLITAACALEQGRDVMAVPGNVLSGRNRGAHALIRDGALIVESADDILTALRNPMPVCEGVTPVSVPSSDVSDERLLACMDRGQAYDMDGLVIRSGMQHVRLLAHLIDLELQGLVRRVGGRFMRS